MRLALAVGLAAAVVTAGVATASSDPVPAVALVPPQLYPLPKQAVVQCHLARQLDLCPARLPRAFIGLRGPAPELVAERYQPGLNGAALMAGISFTYGAPWEPGGGDPTWRQHLWRNRPCCFLHFDLWKALRGTPPFPTRYQHKRLGGKEGDLAPAASLGMACGSGDAGVFFCNHTRFRWRQNGSWYVATLHRFGTEGETLALLARILKTLQPVRS